MSNAVGMEKRWKIARCDPEKTEPVGGLMEFEFKPLGRSAFGARTIHNPGLGAHFLESVCACSDAL